MVVPGGGDDLAYVGLALTVVHVKCGLHHDVDAGLARVGLSLRDDAR